MLDTILIFFKRKPTINDQIFLNHEPALGQSTHNNNQPVKLMTRQRSVAKYSMRYGRFFDILLMSKLFFYDGENTLKVGSTKEITYNNQKEYPLHDDVDRKLMILIGLVIDSQLGYIKMYKESNPEIEGRRQVE